MIAYSCQPQEKFNCLGKESRETNVDKNNKSFLGPKSINACFFVALFRSQNMLIKISLDRILLSMINRGIVFPLSGGDGVPLRTVVSETLLLMKNCLGLFSFSCSFDSCVSGTSMLNCENSQF